MKASHQFSEDKYANARNKARAIAFEQLPESLQEACSLREIDGAALVQCKRWALDPTRRVDWSWGTGIRQYAFRHPKRFELAIWYRSLLCGLSLGRPTWSGSRLRLDFIEAAPVNTPLTGHIFIITLKAAEAYADIIGAQEIRVMHPINSRVRNYYESFGFTYVGGKQDYCTKVLR